MTQNGPKRPKYDPKWSNMAPNGPRMTQNYPKWPKMAQNDPRMTQNDPKWPKNDQKWPNLTQNGPKMTPGFTHFFRNFFWLKKQTFLLLECMCGVEQGCWEGALLSPSNNSKVRSWAISWSDGLFSVFLSSIKATEIGLFALFLFYPIRTIWYRTIIFTNKPWQMEMCLLIEAWVTFIEIKIVIFLTQYYFFCTFLSHCCAEYEISLVANYK